MEHIVNCRKTYIPVAGPPLRNQKRRIKGGEEINEKGKQPSLEPIPAFNAAGTRCCVV